MKAQDIMTTDVVTASDTSNVAQVAKLFLKHGISAVPVVDKSGKLVGIVSEDDLVRRAEIGTVHHRPWWLNLLTGQEVLAAEYIKEHGRNVADVMTRKVVTATPETPLADIANLLEKHRIKRVPIVRHGKIAGIVSRSNLVQALAAQDKGLVLASHPDDAVIRDKVLARLKAEPWHPFLLNVVVNKGQVDLWGLVDSEKQKQAAQVAVEVTPGVVAVKNSLVVRPAAYGE